MPTCHLTATSGTALKLIWSGNTWAYYHSGEDEKESEGKRTYYRVLEVDCSEPGVADKLRDIFEKVFHSVVTRVVIEIPFEDGSEVAEVVGALRGSLANLHFTSK